MQSPNNSGFFLLWSYKYKCSIFRRLERKGLFFRDQNKPGKWQKLKTDKSGKYLIFKKDKFYLIFDIWQQEERRQEEQQRRVNGRQQKRVYLIPRKSQSA